MRGSDRAGSRGHGRRYLDQYLFRKASIDVEFCELAPGYDLGSMLPADAALVSHLARVGSEAIGTAMRTAAPATPPLARAVSRS